MGATEHAGGVGHQHARAVDVHVSIRSQGQAGCPAFRTVDSMRRTRRNRSQPRAQVAQLLPGRPRADGTGRAGPPQTYLPAVKHVVRSSGHGGSIAGGTRRCPRRPAASRSGRRRTAARPHPRTADSTAVTACAGPGGDAAAPVRSDRPSRGRASERPASSEHHAPPLAARATPLHSRRASPSPRPAPRRAVGREARAVSTCGGGASGPTPSRARRGGLGGGQPGRRQGTHPLQPRHVPGGPAAAPAAGLGVGAQAIAPVPRTDRGGGHPQTPRHLIRW